MLFLPLPTGLKYRAKPFVDVTVDRSAKAFGALLTLVLIKPWGLGLDWRDLSYASFGVTALWVALALRARGEYLAAFRRRLDVAPPAGDAVHFDGNDGHRVNRDRIEALLLDEVARFDRSRGDELERPLDRIHRLLEMLYPGKALGAATRCSTATIAPVPLQSNTSTTFSPVQSAGGSCRSSRRALELRPLQRPAGRQKRPLASGA